MIANKDKTHCKNRHEFSADNTQIRTNGTRRCITCSRERARLQVASRTKQYYRTVNLKFFYNMSDEEFEILLKKQYSKCANPACTVLHADSDKLHVDHDHKCCSDHKGRKRKSCGKCVRGLLCKCCNLLLGLAEDDPDYLLGLVEYLKQWSKFPQTSS